MPRGQAAAIAEVPIGRKLTKRESNFREDEGMAGRRCGDCRFYEAGACEIVEGVIDPDDICDQFQPATQDGHMSAGEADMVNVVPMRSQVPRVHLFITRVSENPQTGRRRWYAKASGVQWDKYQERMSVDLFKDFIKRAESREKPPEQFTSRAWSGGLPYLGIAHYLDLEGFGIVGATEAIWVDGNVFKAKGEFDENEMAVRAYEAIKRDIENNVPDDDRIRISIAFVDWSHKHEGYGVFRRRSLLERCQLCERGVGGKTYLAGHLVHLALTRRPAYIDTEIRLEERAMTDGRLMDASSIVGDDMAEELEKRQQELVGRSTAEHAPGVLVVKEYPEDEEEEMMEGDEAPPRKGKRDKAPPPPPPPPPGKPKSKKGMDEEEVPEEQLDEEEEEEVQRRMGKKKKRREGEEVYASDLDGALSLDEAEAFLERTNTRPLGDAWGVLAQVLLNQADSYQTQELPEVFRATLGDFQRRLDMLALRAVLDVQRRLSDGGIPMTQKTDQGAATHPLDETLTALKAAYDNALAEAGTLEERSAILQPAIDELALEIRQALETPAQSGALDMQAIGDMINRSVQQAVSQQFAALNQSGGGMTPLDGSRPHPAAVRRAIHLPPVGSGGDTGGGSNPEVVSRGAPALSQGDGQTPKLRQIVNRSVRTR